MQTFYMNIIVVICVLLVYGARCSDGDDLIESRYPAYSVADDMNVFESSRRVARLLAGGPTGQPSSLPSSQPSSQPSCQPTMQPSSQPSSQPTLQPSSQPSSQPTKQPSNKPSSQPSREPSQQPSSQPSSQPSQQPSAQPSVQPSLQPSAQPSLQPSTQPSNSPTTQPTRSPSSQPTMQPSSQPSDQPTSLPSAQPSSQPTCTPTCPTGQPTMTPSSQPSGQPSEQPSAQPTGRPTTQPSATPSGQPTMQPTMQPSAQPSRQPSCQPSTQPSLQPSTQPSSQPSRAPSSQPSAQPSAMPTMQPSTQPSSQPSIQPVSTPTAQPTTQPSTQPSAQPACTPTSQPSGQPSASPSICPTVQPSAQPTAQPSVCPSAQPSSQPSAVPSAQPVQRPSAGPTSQPTARPSCQPSAQPSGHPTAQPFSSPTSQPSMQPSSNPSAQPSRTPSTQPTAQPTIQPSVQPSAQPSRQPTSQPSSTPTSQPTTQPSTRPTGQPSIQPTSTPTAQPSKQPTGQPSVQPTARPSSQPSASPTTQPSSLPSGQPTSQPTMQPSSLPSAQPSVQPSISPSAQPSTQPSRQPTTQPSAAPSMQPTTQPTSQPTSDPSSQPSAQPSVQPTTQPSVQPSGIPSMQPTAQPSSLPSAQPTVTPTSQPSTQPSSLPTAQPSVQPSSQPSTQPSSQPTVQPSTQPSSLPTCQPSSQPSSQPTDQPTMQPSMQPTAQPTCQPSSQPSTQPSRQPSSQPSAQPSNQPSSQPSNQPSTQPSVQPSSQPSMQPSVQPSSQPSVEPTAQPSVQPSSQPTVQPTVQPSSQPSVQPSSMPSMQPSAQPSTQPSSQPTGQPTEQPSVQPTSQPTIQPSVQPSGQPTMQPSSMPSTQPSAQPSAQPSVQPSGQPSALPSAQPSLMPSSQPSSQPTSAPSSQPSGQPTKQPSGQPTSVPSMQPSSQPSSQPTQPTSQPSSSPSSQPTSQPTLLLNVLYVDLEISSIFVSTTSLNSIAVSWFDLPADSVSLSLGFISLNSSTPNVPTVTPSVFTLASVASELGTSSFVVSAKDTVGSFELVATLSGSSRRQFRIEMTGFLTLQVLPSASEPPVPTLRRAIFSRDGTTVNVVFNAPTDKAGFGTVFLCAALFAFTGKDWARCQWKDSSTVLIYPKYLPAAPMNVLNIGCNITILNGKLKAYCDPSIKNQDCSTWSYVAQDEVAVTAPSTPIAPVAAISMPSSVSSCSSLRVDLTSSAGAAGRPWERVFFDVMALNSASSMSAQPIRDYLAANYTTTQPIVVPANHLVAGLVLSIQVTLCNFLRACDFAVKTVSITAATVLQPVVSIIGADPRFIYAKDTLILSSTAYVPSCSVSSSTEKLRFVWTIYEKSGSVLTLLPALPSISKDPTLFKLNPYVLNPRSSYEVKLTVFSQASGLNSSDSVSVNVRAANLIARISNGLRVTVQAGSSALIDASLSVDPDIPGATGSAAGLSFAWNCAQSWPFYSANCTVSTTIVGDKLRVFAPVGAVNTTSRLALIIYDAQKLRSASSYTDVVVTAFPVPKISLNINEIRASVDVNKKVSIFGTIKPLRSCVAAWSCSDTSVILANVALSSVTGIVTPTGSNAFNLILAAGSLPQSASLVFSLACGGAQSSIEIITNGAPLPGSFTIVPSEGVELNTVFKFNAVQWSDSDLPITFEFSFVSPGSQSQIVLIGKSQSTYAESSLPGGRTQDGYLVNCTLLVYDSLLSLTLASSTVTVRTASQSKQLRQQDVLTLIESTSSASTSTTRLASVISVSSSILNTANCTSTPNCSLLHRQPCADVDATCGRCLSGYFGDSSDRDSACFANSELKSNATSTTTSTNCVSDDQCKAFQKCDESASICVSRSKQCAKNCTLNGICAYVSAITGATLTGSCAIDNPKCLAVCTCDNGYSGEACEMDLATLQLRRTARSKLIDGLRNITAVEDVNEESLIARSRSLQALALKPYELSVQDAVKLMGIVNDTLNQAEAIELDNYQQMLSVLAVTDVLASVFLQSYNPQEYAALNESGSTTPSAASFIATTISTAPFTATTTSASEVGSSLPVGVASIVQVTNTFAALVEARMDVGQISETYFYDNFRINVERREILSENLNATNNSSSTIITLPVNWTVYSPQNEFEISEGESPTTATLQFANGVNVGAVGVKSVLIYPRAYGPGAPFLSNPMYLQVTTEDPLQRNPSRYLTNIDYFFEFNAAQAKYRAFPPETNVSTVCSAERAEGRPGGYKIVEVYHTCPGSGQVILHNCTGVRGVLTSFCPLPAPTCGAVNVAAADAQTVPACALLAYNTTHTHCRCTFPASSSTEGRRRKLYGADSTVFITDSGVANMVAIADYVDSDTENTFVEIVRKPFETQFVDAYAIVYLLSTMWGAILILLGISLYGEYRQPTSLAKNKVKNTAADHEKETISENVANTNNLSDTPAEGAAAVAKFENDDPEQGQQTQKLQQLLQQYIRLSVPEVYRCAGSSTEVNGIETQTRAATFRYKLTEIMVQHRYLSVIFAAQRNANVSLEDRVVALAQLATMMILMLFILALLYGANSPNNDNSCGNYEAMSECLRQNRLFDPTQNLCSWDYNAYNFQYECSFKEKYTLPVGFVNILAVAAMAWAILIIPLDFLFDVLRAPLILDTNGGKVAVEPSSAGAGAGGAEERDVHYVRTVVKGRSAWLARIASTRSQPSHRRGAGEGGSEGEEGSHGVVMKEAWRMRQELLGLRHVFKNNAHAWKDIQTQLGNELRAQAQRVRSRRNAVTALSTAEPEEEVEQEEVVDARGNGRDANDAAGEAGMCDQGHVNHATITDISNNVNNTNDIDTDVVVRGPRSGLIEQCKYTLQLLCEELIAQRYVLLADYSETTSFDDAWGIETITVDPTDSIDPKSPSSVNKYFVRAERRESIYKTLLRTQAASILLRPRLAGQAPNHGGTTILHEFIFDLLGRFTAPAHIFRNTITARFGRRSAVSTDFKIFACLVILALCAYFSYQVIWSASKMQLKWQLCLIIAVLVQIAVEVFLIETLICFARHLWLPSLVCAEVSVALETLHAVGNKMTSGCLPHNPAGLLEQLPSTEKYFFSMPAFLFVSHNLASTRPDLIESMLVQCYSTPWPGALSRRWTQRQTPTDEQTATIQRENSASELIERSVWYVRVLIAGGSCIERGVERIKTAGIRFALIPAAVQLYLLRFVATILLLGLILFGVTASYVFPVLVVLVVLVAAVLTVVVWHMLYSVLIRVQSSRRVAPNAHDNDNANADTIENEHSGAQVYADDAVDACTGDLAGMINDSRRNLLAEDDCEDSDTTISDDLYQENGVDYAEEGHNECIIISSNNNNNDDDGVRRFMYPEVSSAAVDLVDNSVYTGSLKATAGAMALLATEQRRDSNLHSSAHTYTRENENTDEHRASMQPSVGQNIHAGAAVLVGITAATTAIEGISAATSTLSTVTTTSTFTAAAPFKPVLEECAHDAPEWSNAKPYAEANNHSAEISSATKALSEEDEAEAGGGGKQGLFEEKSSGGSAGRDLEVSVTEPAGDYLPTEEEIAEEPVQEYGSADNVLTPPDQEQSGLLPAADAVIQHDSSPSSSPPSLPELKQQKQQEQQEQEQEEFKEQAVARESKLKYTEHTAVPAAAPHLIDAAAALALHTMHDAVNSAKIAAQSSGATQEKVEEKKKKKQKKQKMMQVDEGEPDRASEDIVDRAVHSVASNLVNRAVVSAKHSRKSSATTAARQQPLPSPTPVQHSVPGQCASLVADMALFSASERLAALVESKYGTARNYSEQLHVAINENDEEFAAGDVEASSNSRDTLAGGVHGIIHTHHHNNKHEEEGDDDESSLPGELKEFDSIFTGDEQEDDDVYAKNDDSDLEGEYKAFDSIFEDNNEENSYQNDAHEKSTFSAPAAVINPAGVEWKAVMSAFDEDNSSDENDW